MMELYAIPRFYNDRKELVELEDDVLSIIRQIRELYGDRISVHLDDISGEYYFVEHTTKFEEKLIFSTPHLDGRDLERLIRADSERRSYTDPYLEAEQDQDRIQAEADAKLQEKLNEAGEGLAWALGDGRYGPGYKQSILVTKEISDSG